MRQFKKELLLIIFIIFLTGCSENVDKTNSKEQKTKEDMAVQKEITTSEINEILVESKLAYLKAEAFFIQVSSESDLEYYNVDSIMKFSKSPYTIYLSDYFDVDFEEYYLSEGVVYVKDWDGIWYGSDDQEFVSYMSELMSELHINYDISTMHNSFIDNKDVEATVPANGDEIEINYTIKDTIAKVGTITKFYPDYQTLFEDDIDWTKTTSYLKMKIDSKKHISTEVEVNLIVVLKNGEKVKSQAIYKFNIIEPFDIPADAKENANMQ